MIDWFFTARRCILSRHVRSFFSICLSRLAKCWDQRVSISVCLSVCLSVHGHISKSTRSYLMEFSVSVTLGSDDTAIRYVLPVLWMTSCFHIIVHTGGSGRCDETLPERYRLARSRQQTIWLGSTRQVALLRRGGEVCRLRLPCCCFGWAM